MPKAELENLQHLSCNQDQTDKPIYGKSPITFSRLDQKASRKVRDVLRRCAEIGVLDPDLLDRNPHLLTDHQNGNTHYPTALVHDLTGAAFVNTTSPEDNQWFLHTRIIAPNGKGSYQSGTPAHLLDHQKISVVSGPCLFSAAAVRAIDTDGVSHALTDPSHEPITKEVVKIDVDKRIQPYEADSVLRLTGVLSHLNPNKDITIRLNIPRIEYWFYALSYYEQGLIPGDVLLKWFDQVNTRSAGIEKLMRRRIPHNFNVDSTNTLGMVEPLILDAVERGEKNSFPAIVDKLSTDKDWSYALDRIQPTTFQGIDYISYTIPYLQEANCKDRLIIAAENPEEVKIIESVQRLLGRDSDSATIMGIYPHSNVVLRENPEHGGGRRFLYFYRSPEGELLDSLRVVVAANQSSRVNKE